AHRASPPDRCLSWPWSSFSSQPLERFTGDVRPRRPIGELVTQLVGRLLQLEGGEHHLEVGLARDQLAHLSERTVAVEKRPPVALLPRHGQLGNVRLSGGATLLGGQGSCVLERPQ